MTDETREITRTIDRRARWHTAVVVAVAVVAFLALAFSGYQYVTQAREERQRAQQEQQRAEQEQGRADEAETAVEALCAQVERLGGRCVVDLEELRGERGPGPTDEQVRAAVALFLAANPPQPGRPPTMQEIATAVTVQLAANPPQPGPPGPGPTPEQIAGAVAAHLLANPPLPGTPGEDGDDGQPGQDGADSTVPGPPGEPPLSWTFTTRDVLGQPTTHRCERDDPFEPNAPTYTCQPVAPEESGG